MPPQLPVSNAQELMAYIDRNKGKVAYGSWGAGSYAHLAGAWLSDKLKADMNHVPYKGEAPMLQDLVGGQLQMAFASLQSARPYIESGRLKTLAVTGTQRMDALPKIATMSEQGIKDEVFQVTASTAAFPSSGDGSEFTSPQAWVTPITSGGLSNGGGGVIRLQGTGAIVPEVIWYGNLTTRGGATLTINYVKVPNTPPATNPRGNQLKIGTNGGSGAAFTDVPLASVTGGVWPLLSNTATAEAGTLTVTLPASLDNSADARVRIYFADSTGAGNRPRVDIDNLAITVTTTPVELTGFSID